MSYYRTCTGLQYRAKNFDGNVEGDYHYEKVVNGIPQAPYSYGTGLNMVNDEYLIGQNHPNFHKRRKKGELLCKTYFMHYSRLGSIMERQWDIVGPTSHVWIVGEVGLADGSQSIKTQEQMFALMPELDDTLVQEAAAKIMSESFDALTFLAEFDKTLLMFAGLVKRVISFKKILPSSRKGVANDWLESRYGWRTLLYDLEDLNKALKALSEPSRLRHNKAASFLGKDSWQDIVNADTGTVKLQTKYTYNLEWKMTGSVTADVYRPIVSFNPLVTGWEIIPYSFVIDWLLGVGRSLLASSFLLTEAQYVSSIGIKMTLNTTVSQIPTYWYPGYSGTVSLEGEWKHVLKYRVPCAVPTLPRFRVNLNVAKIYDLIAMLIQRKRR